jgi:hypothetical protein
VSHHGESERPWGETGEAARCGTVGPSHDDTLRFTSVGRTTAFAGAIVALLVMPPGDLRARGLFTPEQVVTGPLLGRLLAELMALKVRFVEMQGQD